MACKMNVIDTPEWITMESMLLQQLSNESDALVAALVQHVLGVATPRARSSSAIAWRAPYVIAAAEAIAGAERARLRWGNAAEGPLHEVEGQLAAVDLSTDVAVIACPEAFADGNVRPQLTTRDALRLGERIAVVAAD